MDRLRLPLFVIAGLVLLIVVGLEAGGSLLPGRFDPAVMGAEIDRQLAESDLDEEDRGEAREQAMREARSAKQPPGMAIPHAALLDGLVLFSVLLMAASMIIPKAVHGKIQGIVTLVVSIVVLVVAFFWTLKAFILLMIMVSLFLATPFGTIAYLAVWGFFDRGGASALLGAAMFLKLAFIALLAFAHQAFLAMKRQVLMLLTTILATFLTAFLHNFVPIILVSITDAIAAIIIGILIIVWCIALLIGAVISVVKAII